MSHVEREHLYFVPLDGVPLGDRIAGKLADALCLLDEVLELTAYGADLRIDGVTRLPIQRARAEVNGVMLQLVD